MIRSFFISVLFAALFLACNRPYNVGKKRGYYRIDFPEKAYKVFDQPGYPYRFEYPVYASVEKDSMFFSDRAEDWWVNINIPSLNGRIYVSYKPIGGQYTFDSLVRDGYRLAYQQHVDVANRIDDSLMVTPNGVEGIYFSLGGNTATANQFFLTDSTKHFLRGALYFDAAPNSDSLGIVNEFLKKDLLHLINTLQWSDRQSNRP
ncbi:MAG: hypothetical protein RL750_363 [Bacteroidota bacterium]|jgi:gliding motility-associated lipoprotein GldD